MTAAVDDPGVTVVGAGPGGLTTAPQLGRAVVDAPREVLRRG